MEKVESGRGELQLKLFERVRNRLQPGESLGNRMKSLLHLSQDSIYRRIRGETALTLPELSVICKEFEISMDELLGSEAQGDSVAFRLYRLTSGGYHEYMKFILDEFKQNDNNEEQRILYSAKDIPIFYFFLFPELAVFKAYFFGKILWTNEHLKDKTFNFEDVINILDSPIELLQEIGSDLASSYLKMPGIEIWNHNTINGHLYQISYLWEAGLFGSKESALLILQRTEELVRHVQKQAEEGKKFSSQNQSLEGASSELYFSEGIHLENAILQVIGEQKRCYVLHNTGDYLFTSDHSFCQRTADYLENVLRKSSLISRVGEKDRHKLFHNYHEKIDRLRRVIET